MQYRTPWVQGWWHRYKNINRRIAFYTNAKTEDYDALTLIDILRRRQNIEDFLKDKKNDLSADAFCGGAIEPMNMNEMKPSKEEIKEIEKKLDEYKKLMQALELKFMDEIATERFKHEKGG